MAGRAGENELFVIGGGEIYEQCMPFADRLYITEVHEEFEGDTFFPPIDREQWVEIEREHHPVDADHVHSFDFVVLDRKK